MNRVRTPIDDRARFVRPGNRHPLARPEFDAGAVAPETRLERMILVLSPDGAQQQALEDLLAAQQDPESAYYHQWLSPDEYGERFGVSQSDAAQVSGWLEGHGLTVELVSRSRREIIFSGTAAQVASAFHVEIHAYVVDGELHYANAGDPEIPIALIPVIQGVISMHDFHSRPQHRAARLTQATPDYTAGTAHYLAPADFATIYNVATAYAGGFDGSGQSIAVAGRTNFNLADVASFRSMFGLPANAPTVVLTWPRTTPAKARAAEPLLLPAMSSR
ncbi:MAG TPA: protease pro-enzyme activation domain-containing protein [Bryobacteraceae bacterium]